MKQFDTREGVIISVSDDNLVQPLNGFCIKAESTMGTKGVLIFIPTEKQDELISLIQVREEI